MCCLCRGLRLRLFSRNNAAPEIRSIVLGVTSIVTECTAVADSRRLFNLKEFFRRKENAAPLSVSGVRVVLSVLGMTGKAVKTYRGRRV